MRINFKKYHGAGNDFVMINNTTGRYNNIDRDQIARLCHRNFGVGADGLMLLNNAEGYDFGMRYFNSDGGEADMCGNGGRCIVRFALDEKVCTENDHMKFIAADGPHEAKVIGDDIRIKMIDIAAGFDFGDGMLINTGVPHFVHFFDEIDNIDIKESGRTKRWDSRFGPKGANVNFVKEIAQGLLQIRTYERGVEDETLACGTGCVASALVYSKLNPGTSSPVHLRAKGGNITVFFNENSGDYKDVWLQGPAEFVFEGSIGI